MSIADLDVGNLVEKITLADGRLIRILSHGGYSEFVPRMYEARITLPLNPGYVMGDCVIGGVGRSRRYALSDLALHLRTAESVLWSLRAHEQRDIVGELIIEINGICDQYPWAEPEAV